MDFQEATDILKKLLDKDALNAEEKEAIFTALGVLSWALLSKSRIKAMGNRRKGLINDKPSA